MNKKTRKIDSNKPKIKLPSGKNYIFIKKIIEKHHLHTICESGNCPNIRECWETGTATFMILGDICTRSCKFCSVKTGKPKSIDISEPANIAKSVKLMKLKHCVLTSVDRDDLQDGGSIIWAKTINEIRKISPSTTIEALIPDFQGNIENLQKIIEVKPEIISHNLETVKSLTKHIRIHAKYEQSLFVLKTIKDSGIVTKSGIMVGLGETEKEIYETMDNLIAIGCDILTIGQYLQPTKQQLPVQKYISQKEFDNYKKIGLKKGFRIVESSSLVRTSFHADQHLLK